MDRAAEEGSFAKIDFWQWVAICMQGLRIAIPAALILAVGATPVKAMLNAMPSWLTDGLSIGGGMVVAVGYAMVINMMASREVWPFFALGDRLHVWWRSTFLQGSWNYERMQNGGWAYSLIPAIKKLYTTKEDRAAALKRHMEFFNTHPYVASPVIGVTLALEEERANGAPIDDVTIQGVKVGMMGPLAGVGDPVFWYTVKPIVGALAASLAISGSIVGPILYFVVWNAIRMGFMWYTQEFGYKAGSKITDDLSGGILQDITRGASMLGMFILAALIERWVVVDFSPVKVSTIKQQAGAYIDWDKLPKGSAGIKEALSQQAAGRSLDKYKVTTLQDNLNQLIPGLMALLLTFLCMWLLKKKVSPIVIILGLFVFGVLMHVIGWM